MQTAHDDFVCALLVGDYENDRSLLYQIFRKSGWQLLEAPDRRSAKQYLGRQPVQVVITEAETPHWNWKTVLDDLRQIMPSPQLIVTSRVADDCLWAEVLNIGAYDLLLQPLEREETERVIASARRHFDPAPQRSATPVTTVVAS